MRLQQKPQVVRKQGHLQGAGVSSTRLGRGVKLLTEGLVILGSILGAFFQLN
jgi:hypothetical protein